MLFGVREICDVVLRAKTTQKIGNKVFYKHEPVIYFDTLKTSTLEGAATTVYATGGRGNTRLVAWEGERTLTFTMEDALISPEGFAILSGAGLIEAGSTEGEEIYVHATLNAIGNYTDSDSTITIDPAKNPELDVENIVDKDINGDPCLYAMIKVNDEIISEPYLCAISRGKIVVNESAISGYKPDFSAYSEDGNDTTVYLLLDYYMKKTSGTTQIDITADSFGENYYLEASTLFRTKDGVDLPAEFVIPNCKVQSNFTFTMAPTGDPSTFTFTMDAFPDVTRFNNTKKVLAALQIITTTDEEDIYGSKRKATAWDYV